MDINVVSYPERGRWGNGKFRGNTTGFLIKDLIEHFKPANVLDPMCGSGTTKDVCEELGLDCDCFDLSMGFNLLSSPLPPKRYGMIFIHPPYWNIIRYSEDPEDLSNCKTFSEYMQKLGYCIERLAEYLTEDGVLIVQIGDVRKRGSYYPLGAYVQVLYRRELKEKIIKIQHNVRSNFFHYGNIIRIMHEEILCLKGFKKITWSQLVKRVFIELNATQLTLPQIYQCLANHPKRTSNPTFEATIRRTLQETATPIDKGVWGEPLSLEETLKRAKAHAVSTEDKRHERSLHR